MLSFFVGLHKLFLPANTKASMDYVPPLFNDGIADNYTIPAAVPVAGNEEALGHVHELALVKRNLVLRNARMGYQGQQLGGGVLRVLGSNDESVKVSFSAEGLADKLKGVKLRNALAGNLIDTLPEGGLVNHAKNVTMVATPHASHCFPMHVNPDLYGSENPAWQPSESTWDATKAYVINDRVALEEAGPVARTWYWQCLGSNTNKRPDIYPLLWRRIRFGIVNSYDVDGQLYESNTAGGNFFAMVPWFRYDWLVRTALAGIGIKAQGTWFSSPATPYMLLPNSTPLDSAFGLRNFGALRNETHPQVNAYAPNAVVRLPAVESSTPPYFVDPFGLWNPNDYTFTPDSSGVWQLQLFVMCEFATADRVAIWPVYDNGSPVIDPATSQPYMATAGPSTTYHEQDIFFSMDLDNADIGQKIAFRAGALNAGANMAAMEIYGCHIIATFTPTPGVNSYKQTIDPAQHVPDMELGEFLQNVADTFGLEVVPDLANATLALNVKADVIRNYTTAEDQSQRLAGPIELDHGRAVPGLRFAWDVEQTDPASLLNSTLMAEVDFEEDLAGAVSGLTHAVVRSTRKLFQAEVLKRDTGDIYVWRQKGYTIPPRISGDADRASEMPTGIKPVMMDEQWVDGRKLLMPYLEQAGESALFATGPKSSDLLLCINGGKQEAREDAAEYPGALSWGLSNTGEEVESLLLQPQRNLPTAPNYWQRWHQAWVDTLVASEPVTTDLLTDLPFILGRKWHRIMPIHEQLYLAEKMPLSYGDGSADELLSKGAYLRRVRPVVEAWPVAPVPPPVFVCYGQGYGSFTVAPGGTAAPGLNTSTGHYAIRDADGNVVVDGSLEAGGSYCLYASDASGNMTGEVTDLFLFYGELAGMVIDGFTALRVIYMEYWVIPSLPSFAQQSALEQATFVHPPPVDTLPNFHSGAVLNDFYFGPQIGLPDTFPLAHVGVLPIFRTQVQFLNCALTQTAVDAIINHCDPSVPGYCDLSGGTSSGRSTDSDDNYDACVGGGWTFILN